ncbi:MAG: hypothetical protein ABJG47_03875 [Ekhidna sp.]
MQINSDLHCHPGLKGSNGDLEPKEIWNRQPPSGAIHKLNKQIRKAINALARGSQADLNACAKGQARLLFVSIYPFEIPFLKIDPKKPFRLLFKFILPKKKYTTLGEAALGIKEDKIGAMLASASSPTGFNYFEEYESELKFLIDAQQTKSDDPDLADFSFQLANDYDHYQGMINDPNKIVGILSVEGAHAFGKYAFANFFCYGFEQLSDQQKNDLRTSFDQNIQRVKSNQTPGAVPFFITFSHHFNNLLAGHSTSLSDKSVLKKTFFKTFFAPGMRHLFDQRPNLETGFSELGLEVLKSLLDRSNGRRILIDTKHMSPKSRKQFYEILEHEYANDPVPIVHSHGAVSGWKTLDEALSKTNDRHLDAGSFISRWTINLTDEDLSVTFKSNGLVGVCLHEGRMPGSLFKEQKKRLKKESEIQDLYLKLLWSNVFHMAKVHLDTISQYNLVERNNWEGLTIGSDYDGIVDPFDDYRSIADYPELRQEMIEYVLQQKEIIDVVSQQRLTQDQIQTILGSHSVEDVVELLFYKNADQFLKQYFTKAYLEA